MPVDGQINEKQLAHWIEEFRRRTMPASAWEGFVGALIDSRRSLQQEYGRLLDYWLCIHGLTVSQFRMGVACQEEGCDVGKEHALGIAAKRADAAADLTQPGQEG